MKAELCLTWLIVVIGLFVVVFTPSEFEELYLTWLIVIIGGGLVYIWFDLRSKLVTTTKKLNWIAKKTIDLEHEKR